MHFESINNKVKNLKVKDRIAGAPVDTTPM